MTSDMDSDSYFSYFLFINDLIFEPKPNLEKSKPSVRIIFQVHKRLHAPRGEDINLIQALCSTILEFFNKRWIHFGVKNGLFISICILGNESSFTEFNFHGSSIQMVSPSFWIFLEFMEALNTGGTIID